MKLFCAALAKHKLTFIKLRDCMQYLPIAAQWVEDEWDIRKLGIEARTENHEVDSGTHVFLHWI